MRGKRIEDKVDQVAQRLERVDAMLVVREPGTSYAAEAYEGLRKHVQFASQQQRIYFSTLISLLDDIAAGATLETVTWRISDRLIESGVREVSDPAMLPQAFDEVDPLRETRSAWVLDPVDGRVNVIRPGTRHPEPPAVLDQVPEASGEAVLQGHEVVQTEEQTVDPKVARHDASDGKGD